METYLGESMPKLGFGLMRLPMNGTAIDLEETKRRVDLFLSAGCRYFDTAWGYNAGDSERAAKAALVDRYPRESFSLATKLPAWMAKNRADAEQMFDTSLERTGAGYFDFYLLHNLGGKRVNVFEEYDLWSFVRKKKEAGLIRHLGFSFHDTADVLDRVLTAHPEAEFVQLQINYADWESERIQSRACYETARKHGKPVIIMEPVKGGSLSALPPEAAAPLRAVHPDASFSSWALRFAASLPGLITVLSGMSNLEQMRDNLATFTDFRPLDEAERAAIGETQRYLASVPTIPCTGCDYCAEGCPQNVAISGAFTAYNLFKVYQNITAAKGSYSFPIEKCGLSRAGECIGCGACEAVCPQQISIIEELKKASAVLDH